MRTITVVSVCQAGSRKAELSSFAGNTFFLLRAGDKAAMTCMVLVC